MDALNVVSLQQAKEWLRIDDDDDFQDAVIISLIKSCINQIQLYTLQILYPQVLTQYTGVCGTTKIYQYPITSIEDVNNNGVYEPFEEFTTDHYVEIKSSVRDRQLVTYTAGYGWTYDLGSEVPEDIKTAIKEYLTYLYENRDDPYKKMPAIVQWLLGPYRRVTLF